MYGEAADVFSYGMVVAELITLQKPGTHFWIRDAADCYELDFSELVQKVPQDCPKQLLRLVIDCCAYDADQRPTFQQIIDQLDQISQFIAANYQAQPAQTGQTASAPVAIPGGSAQPDVALSPTAQGEHVSQRMQTR